MSDYKIIHADCLEAMPTLPENSVDSVVTDPPYGLSFMGKDWDHGVPGAEFWKAALRVMKPGAYLLAFGGTRTFHRLTVAIEDAGFEVRDCLMWIYGSGFPKSLDVSKAIDKAAGAERSDALLGGHIGISVNGGDPDNENEIGNGVYHGINKGAQTRGTPSTDAAKHWSGWGTALKPAWEPIILARKPLSGTVAENVQRWGTGAINIDASRIGSEAPRLSSNKNLNDDGWSEIGKQADVVSVQGRFPANVLLDEEAGRALDGQSGVLKSGQPGTICLGKNNGAAYGAESRKPGTAMTGFGDSGGASRFFKTCNEGDIEWLERNLNQSFAGIAEGGLSLKSPAVVSALNGVATWVAPEGIALSVLEAPSISVTAKELRTLVENVTLAIPSIVQKYWLVSQLEKNTLEQGRVRVAVGRTPTGTMTITVSHWRSDGSADPVTFSTTGTSEEAGGAGSAARFKYCAKASKRERGEGNTHPTVKPQALLQYLAKLITPPNGLILDPFNGSGSMAIAAIDNGFKYIGIEKEKAYVDIANGRIEDHIFEKE